MVDVRRRACKGHALDALVRWVGDHADSWVPVNKTWMPSLALRTEARTMWSARQRDLPRLPDDTSKPRQSHKRTAPAARSCAAAARARVRGPTVTELRARAEHESDLPTAKRAQPLPPLPAGRVRSLDERSQRDALAYAVLYPIPSLQLGPAS